MKERVVTYPFLISLFVFFTLGMVVSSIQAQEIAGTLVFEEPFEEDTIPQWTDKYIAGSGTSMNLGLVEDGAEGGLSEVILVDDPGVGMTDVQFSFVFPTPEGADQHQWRITYYIWVDIAPFMIRPIIAMSEDPWTGTSIEVEVPEDQAEQWVFIDVTLDPGDFLTTPDLIVIFHMGGNEAYELRFDDLKVYLLTEEADVNSWMMY